MYNCCLHMYSITIDFNCLFLYQHATEPTKYFAGSHALPIPWILFLPMKKTYFYCPGLGLSDHACICFIDNLKYYVLNMPTVMV